MPWYVWVVIITWVVLAVPLAVLIGKFIALNDKERNQ